MKYEKLITTLFSLSQWLEVKLSPIFRRMNWSLIKVVSSIFALSFVFASSVSTFAANLALNSALKAQRASSATGAASPKGAGFADVATGGASVSELKRNILTRNLFNSEGKAPLEDSDTKVTQTKDLDFDKVVCTEEALPVEIIGTIYTGDPKKSFVIIKDAKVEDADVYKTGDLVIDHEDFEVYAVEQTFVEFRKGDAKICVAVKGHETTSRDGQGTAAKANDAPTVRAENIENFTFDSSFLQNEIGPGYANILNAAKMIPETEEGTGKMVGFRLISIVPGSLFDKMKLQNGDVIQDVNGVSMRDPSQGFKLYQSLQEEREITIGIMRGGTPMVRKVRVK